MNGKNQLIQGSQPAPTDVTAGVSAPGNSRAAAGSAFPFWYVNVTTKGSEGTINLMWKEWPIQWINNKEMAKEIREFLDSQNIDERNGA